MMEVGEVRYYYLKEYVNDGNRPFGCVAFRRNADGTVNRGVSLCSTRDNFNRRHGRGLAMKRLLDAEKAGMDTYFMNYQSPCCPGTQNPLVNYVEHEGDEEFGFLRDGKSGDYFSGCVGGCPTEQEMNIMGIAGKK